MGERVLGRFTIERRLGSGGFGTVYSAYDERLQRRVAVKVLDAGPEAARRVLREAQAAARLSHPRIAMLYELAEDGERAYLVGELVEGATLRALSVRGELSDRDVASIGFASAEALAHAHRHGVVHRDIKPHNILVPTGTSDVKLVDFGIARLFGEPTLTASGAVLGTLAYMAPEQADGLRPGPAADVYSLAITLYECWSGLHPLQRGNPAATARAIGEPIPSLAEERRDLPPELLEAIDAGLDPDPEVRPLASELEATLRASAPRLGGEPLPPLPEFDGEEPNRVRQAAQRLAPRLAGSAALGGLTLAAMLWAGASALAPLLAGFVAVLGLGRPRVAYLVGVLGSVSWMLLGAGWPGAALTLALLALPPALIAPRASRALVLPPLAPALAAVGLGAVYPAAAGLTSQAAQRLTLGAAGYLWVAAAEAVSGRSLFLGQVQPAPPGWRESASDALTSVIGPLFAPSVVLGALVWAAAAWTLPLLIRGRLPVLDVLGALLWASGLVAAHRLVAGTDVIPGSLVATAALAAGGALIVSHLAATRAPVAHPTVADGGRREPTLP